MKMLCVILFALLTLVASPSAEDFCCDNFYGCPAYRIESHRLVVHRFRRGEWVSTEDGWIVPPHVGWWKQSHSGTMFPHGAPSPASYLLPTIFDHLDRR